MSMVLHTFHFERTVFNVNRSVCYHLELFWTWHKNIYYRISFTIISFYYHLFFILSLTFLLLKQHFPFLTIFCLSCCLWILWKPVLSFDETDFGTLWFIIIIFFPAIWSCSVSFPVCLSLCSLWGASGCRQKYTSGGMEKNYLKVWSGHRTWCLGGITFLSSPVLATELCLGYIYLERVVCNFQGI